jgi:hypothetical protein
MQPNYFIYVVLNIYKKYNSKSSLGIINKNKS